MPRACGPSAGGSGRRAGPRPSRSATTSGSTRRAATRSVRCRGPRTLPAFPQPAPILPLLLSAGTRRRAVLDALEAVLLRSPTGGTVAVHGGRRTPMEIVLWSFDLPVDSSSQSRMRDWRTSPLARCATPLHPYAQKPALGTRQSWQGACRDPPWSRCGWKETGVTVTLRRFASVDPRVRALGMLRTAHGLDQPSLPPDRGLISSTRTLLKQ
jgi:hypothetical protein